MPSSRELRAVFTDTESLCENETEIRILTDKLVSDTVVYNDYDYMISESHLIGKSGHIRVVEGSTLQVARQYAASGKTAVLNFANPIEPGGGVKRGAMAQEESLCRSSNLYFSLTRPDVIEQYYNRHQQEDDYAFSDRAVYSPGVAVIKTDDEIPVRLEPPFFVDVITCAAPYNARSEIPDLDKLFNHRIKAVLEAAIKNGNTNMILGAWGCGVFCNPPQLVAGEFYKVLVTENYRYAFDNVVFAIVKSPQNLELFRNTFAGDR